jgi:predicted lysophospholipase L1 biosynthesis ABC-type transport system permease subunit
VDGNQIAPGYFAAMQIPILAGRDFTAADGPGAPRRGIVSQSLAQRMFPNENAVGKYLEVPEFGTTREPPVEIVGIAGNSKLRNLTSETDVIYVPLAQTGERMVSIAIRTHGEPRTMIPALRREIAALDQNLPVYQVRTLEEQVERSLWRERSAASLTGSFSIVGLIVAAFGIYSLLTHGVAQRRREIGIRMAMGAERLSVLKLVVGEGLKITGLGMFVGAVAAFVLARFAGGFDLLPFLATPVLLILVASAAAYFPARSATLVDPITALRD